MRVSSWYGRRPFAVAVVINEFTYLPIVSENLSLDEIESLLLKCLVVLHWLIVIVQENPHGNDGELDVPQLLLCSMSLWHGLR